MASREAVRPPDRQVADRVADDRQVADGKIGGLGLRYGRRDRRHAGRTAQNVETEATERHGHEEERRRRDGRRTNGMEDCLGEEWPESRQRRHLIATSEGLLDEPIGDGDRRDRADDDAREDHPDEPHDPVLDPLLRAVLGVGVRPGEGLLDPAPDDDSATDRDAETDGDRDQGRDHLRDRRQSLLRARRHRVRGERRVDPGEQQESRS